ncbi:MAG: GNAT family N-acetyltransferase [Clostridia bacterium]
MTNKEIFEIARRQSAIDGNCAPEDFCIGVNRVVRSAATEGARKYLTLPFFCDLVSYGNHIVASVDARIEEDIRAYIDQYPAEHCFETPHLHQLDDILGKFDQRICFMAEYFLPDVGALRLLPCTYPIQMLQPRDFADCYAPQWSNALCKKRRELDVLAAAAFDQGHMIGLAACSADCESMWQIGIDVLPAYRRRGVASALTSRLALEILQLGKVPFYCAAWSNIRSVRNAIKSGFRPAWVEMTAKSKAFVDEMNR